MAPRRQAKQAAAETVVVAADGNVTPPKKRKTAAKSSAMDEPKQTRGKSRQAKAIRQESEVVSEPASPPKKSRGKAKNTAAVAAPKNSATAAAFLKNNTKSRSKKQVKQQEDAAMENNNTDEEVVQQVTEKKTRGGKAASAAKMAGIKVIPKKPKAKAPAAKKQKAVDAVENGAGDGKKNAVAKRTTRHVKAVEESDVPAQPAARASRKRKNMETITEAEDEQTTKEEEDEDEEENEATVAAASKKSRGRAKKVDTDDAPKVTSKGRSRKNPAKEVTPPEETEVKEQDAAIKEDNSKTKNAKSTKKGNAKKAVPRGKRYAETEKANDVQVEETAMPEEDIKENGETHLAEPVKQKKRNAGKANTATNGKTKAKGRQKKAAAASVDEKDATNAKNETTEKMNAALEVDENNAKDNVLSSSTSNLAITMSEADDVLQINEENEVNESITDAMQDETLKLGDASDNEMERSVTFLCFPKNHN